MKSGLPNQREVHALAKIKIENQHYIALDVTLSAKKTKI
jgi:hypothetical protein